MAFPLRRHLLVVVAVMSVFSDRPLAQARVDSSRRQTAPTALWAIEVNRSNLGTLSDRLAGQAHGHVNALLVNNCRLKKRQRQRLNRLVKRFGFAKILLPHASIRSVRRAEAICLKFKKRHPTSLCTLRAGSLTTAHRLASSPSVDRVVVRLRRLPSSKSLKRSAGSGHASVVVLVEIGRGRSLNKQSWRNAIARAAADAGLDLAVSPSGRYRSRALTDYIKLLNNARAPPRPPSPPLLLHPHTRGRERPTSGWTQAAAAACATRPLLPTAMPRPAAGRLRTASAQGGDTVGVMGAATGT